MTEEPPTSEELLRMWERAQGKASREVRALMVLAAAHPEVGVDLLSQLSIGQRDERLLDVRERFVGRALALSTDCPTCHQPVELAVDTQALTATTDRRDLIGDGGRRHRIRHDDTVVDFRLPNTADLDALAPCDDVEIARCVLLDRCVQSATDAGGASLRGSQLPVAVQDAVEQEMDRLDPLAVTRLDLRCPDCGEGWQARLDIAEIVLTELSAQARILLREVAALAGHYHWSEQSILAMSARRRRAYLELAG